MGKLSVKEIAEGSTKMGSIGTIWKIFMNGLIMSEVWGLNKFLGEVKNKLFGLSERVGVSKTVDCYGKENDGMQKAF